MGACSTGFKRFIEQTSDTDEPVLISSLFNGKNTVPDLIWLSGKVCTVEKIKKFARDIALVNIELIKPLCSEQDYELTLNFLKTGDDANRAAIAAAITADASTYADADAAYAVHHAAHTVSAYITVDVTRAVARVVTSVARAGKVDFTPYLEELFS